MNFHINVHPLKQTTLWFLAALLLLSGCGYSVDDLAGDHDRRNEILKACADMGEASQHDELCRMAARAQVEAAKRAIQNSYE